MKNSTGVVAFVILVFLLMGCGVFKRAVTGEAARWTIEAKSFDSEGTVDYDLVMKAINQRINAAGLTGEAVRDPSDPSHLIVSVSGFKKEMDIAGYLFKSYRLELKKVAHTEGFGLSPFDSADAARSALKDGEEALPYETRDGESQKFLIVIKTAILKGEDIRDARAVTGMDGNHQINVHFKPQASEQFGRWTSQNVGSYLAVVLDGTIISAPVIQGQIFDSAQIQGKFDKSSAEQLALALRSGSIPAAITIVEGPTSNAQK